MAEAAAAFYAVETAVEGAAVGAIAVSQSTVPLHVRFRKLALDSTLFDGTLASSVDIVKGRAYIFGGDTYDGKLDTRMKVITLPSDIENGESDFQALEPNIESDRPLQKYASLPTSGANSEGFEETATGGSLVQTNQRLSVQARASHCSTSIDSTVYILAGRKPKALSAGESSEKVSPDQLFNCDQIYAFSTQTNKWSIIEADIQKCTDGLPPPRIGASCTSTPHPEPDSAIEITIHSHGTIFLHGGYDTQGERLRDTWAFDVSSKVWTRWPEIPQPHPEDVAGEGKVTCVGKSLWQVGDGFGKIMYIDFEVLRGKYVSETSGPHSGETGVKPVQDGWKTLSFGSKAAHSALQGEVGAGSQKHLLNKADNLPVPRQGAGFVPVKLGAGRSFLLYFMGQDGPDSLLGDVWSFQIKAEDRSPAALKDYIRHAIGKDTGENQWARCDVVESTKEEGQVHPPRGLVGFAADRWLDLGGGAVLLLGGIDASGQLEPRCWIMTVE